MRAADFVQETTTSIAGTSGDGAVTLTQIAGLPRFSSALGTSAVNVRYVIEDTANSKFEQGIGSVAANVLTRTRPQVTWDGTTWKDGSANAPAVALQFGSTPTSGNVVVRMAATAEMSAPIMESTQMTLGSANWRDYQLNYSITLDNNGSGQTMTADKLYFYAHRLEMGGLLSGIQCQITAAVASSFMRVGLYDIGPDGLPSKLLATFNPVNCATTGYKTDTAISTWTPAYGLWLTPGWYAIAILPSAAFGLNFGPYQPRSTYRCPFGHVQDGYGFAPAITVSQPYASGLPAAYPGGGVLMNANTSFSFPMIGLKVVP